MLPQTMLPGIAHSLVLASCCVESMIAKLELHSALFRFGGTERARLSVIRH